MKLRDKTLCVRSRMVSALALPLIMAGAVQADDTTAPTGENSDMTATQQQEANKPDAAEPTAATRQHADKEKDNPKVSRNDQYMTTAADYSVMDTVSDWAETPQNVAKKMVEKYGAPDAVTDTMLIWHNNGPWERTIVHKEEIEHNFPMPHTDVLEQVIKYEVPEEKFTDLAKYDGSVVAFRTNGELAARCDKEAANFLALNLANDIIEGNRSVADARAHYAETIQKVMAGETPEYVQALQFNVQMADTRDPDQEFDKEQDAAMAGASGQQRAEGSVAYEREQQAGSTTSGDRQQRSDVTAMSEAELNGKIVLTVDGNELGEVDRITTIAGGSRVAVVEVGGILGIGADDVEIPLEELELSADGRLKSQMSRERLISESDSEEY